MTLNDQQEELCASNSTDFSDLAAVFVNCTLKAPDQASHTELLMSTSEQIMRRNDVAVETIRPTAHEIAFGVYPDMTEHGWRQDDWPTLWKKVPNADIQSSVCRLIIERLYGMSGELNDKGQYIFYGKVGSAVVTGNEDGVEHCVMSILYSLGHLGYTIPPQADCGWIGEIGPGASYGEDGTGFDNDFTQRNTTIMTWNLMHMARKLEDTGGLSNHGNNRQAMQAGCRFDFENPEHRV